jgi:hypothetical protein
MHTLKLLSCRQLINVLLYQISFDKVKFCVGWLLRRFNAGTGPLIVVWTMWIREHSQMHEIWDHSHSPGMSTWSYASFVISTLLPVLSFNGPTPRWRNLPQRSLRWRHTMPARQVTWIGMRSTIIERRPQTNTRRSLQNCRLWELAGCSIIELVVQGLC